MFNNYSFLVSWLSKLQGRRQHFESEMLAEKNFVPSISDIMGIQQQIKCLAYFQLIGEQQTFDEKLQLSVFANDAGNRRLHDCI